MSTPKPYPGLIQAIGLLILALLLGLGVTILVSGTRYLAEGDLTAAMDAWTLALGNTAAFFGAGALGWLRTGRPFGAVFPLGGFPARLLPPLILFAPAALIVLNLITSTLLSIVPEGPAENWLAEQTRDLLTLLLQDRVAAFIAVVIMAPITEEIFFRGLLLQGFVRRYGPEKAILVTTILFSVIHFNPVQLPATFLLGAYLAWLTLRTGTLWPAILAHAANNLTALLATWSMGAEEAETFGAGPWVLNLAGILAAVFLGRLIVQYARKPAPAPAFPDSGNPPRSAGV